MISSSLGSPQRSELPLFLTIKARPDHFPTLLNWLNHSVSPSFPGRNPGILPTTPPLLFWAVALPVGVLEVAPLPIFYAPFPPAYL